jgi:hypothetical protein
MIAKVQQTLQQMMWIVALGKGYLSQKKHGNTHLSLASEESDSSLQSTANSILQIHVICWSRWGKLEGKDADASVCCNGVLWRWQSLHLRS